MPTLRQQFDARRNNFDVIRLLLAALVAVSHGIVMSTGDQPSWGQSTLGDYAVDGFFILSGFLVARSYLQLRSFPRFVWHRFLRIMPAFWVCLLVIALVVAPVAAVFEGKPFSTPFTGKPSAWQFVLANAGLLIQQYDIAGLLASNPTPLVFDGALWTLALEALCYALLGTLGMLGFLRRRAWLVPALAVALWFTMAIQGAGVDVVVGDQTVRMVLMFLLGAAAWLFAERVPLHPGLAGAAAVVFVGSAALLDNYRLVGAVPLAYLLLWAAIALPWSMRLPADLSYGVYIYHWPLQQVLALTLLAQLPTFGFVVASLCLVTLPAALSWYGIEKRALARKNAMPPGWLRRRPAREDQPTETVGVQAGH